MFCQGFWTCEKTQSRQDGNNSGSESLKHRFMIKFSEHFQPASGITITDSALYHEGDGNLEIISIPLKSPFRLDVLNIVFTVKEKMTFDELDNSIEIYISFSETGDDWSNWNRFKISHYEADYTQIRFGTEGWEGKNAKGPFHKYFRFKVVSDESNKNRLAIKNAMILSSQKTIERLENLDCSAQSY